ncbi:MAG: hypothetical protein Ct9H300mP12_02440 [Acidimicrobiales bacterium]|nr:MAG: hypothetical protein Ct9H300mP12_02440 [Acidimicrobiales bacterium]
MILPPYVDWVDLGDKRILIVDDVADTGHTLLWCGRRHCPGGEVRSACCTRSPSRW